MIHQESSERAAGIREPVRKTRRRRIQHDLSRAERRRTEENHPPCIRSAFACIGIDNADARDALTVCVIIDTGNDRVRDRGQVARSLGCRQRRRQAGEVGAERTAALALVAIHAAAAAEFELLVGGFGEVCGTADDQVALGERGLDLRLDRFLHAIHFERRLEYAVRQLRQSFRRTADAGECFHVVVPGRYVIVADRPVDAVTVFRIRAEVDVAPAITLPVPLQRPPAEVITA